MHLTYFICLPKKEKEKQKKAFTPFCQSSEMTPSNHLCLHLMLVDLHQLVKFSANNQPELAVCCRQETSCGALGVLP